MSQTGYRVTAPQCCKKHDNNVQHGIWMWQKVWMSVDGCSYCLCLGCFMFPFIIYLFYILIQMQWMMHWLQSIFNFIVPVIMTIRTYCMYSEVSRYLIWSSRWAAGSLGSADRILNPSEGVSPAGSSLSARHTLLQAETQHDSSCETRPGSS